MAQEVPSNLAYLQAAEILKKLKQQYALIQNKDPETTAALVAEALTKFASISGTALTQYEPIELSEVPHSQKMNRLYSSVQSDLNLLEDQIDLLNASTIAAHNFIKTEILKAQRENLQLRNKLKVLEMYSNSDDDSLVFLGDSFNTEDQIDWTMSGSGKASILASGALALAVTGTKNAVSNGATIKILTGSNGFTGNNQEITDPTVAYINPVTHEREYTFVSEAARYSNLAAVLDNKPNTWFEFEKYWVTASDRAKAKNYNFKYAVTNDGSAAYLIDGRLVGTDSKIDWADGIATGDALRLNLEIDLKTAKKVNLLKLLPYGLKDNSNTPIKILTVKTSLDGNNWTILPLSNIWLSNSLDKQISQLTNEKVIVGSGAWATDGTSIRYIRFEIEQPRPINSYIGHLYYLPKDTVTTSVDTMVVIPSFLSTDGVAYNVDLPYDANMTYDGKVVTAPTTNSTVIIEGDTTTSSTLDALRQEGPTPPITNPQLYYSNKSALVNNLIQKKEYFKGKRWVIGIRDITILENVYSKQSTMVSKRFDIPGIVDRVAIEADIQIPDNYDLSIPWVRFYISPDDGATWHEVSRIQDDFLNIPEIVAYNDPTPKDLRDPAVGYYDVKGTVNSLRVKIEITRPDTDQYSTPVVKSYKLKVVKR